MKKNKKNITINNSILKEIVIILRAVIVISCFYLLGNIVMMLPGSILWDPKLWIDFFINPLQWGYVYALPEVIFIVAIARILFILVKNRLVQSKKLSPTIKKITYYCEKVSLRTGRYAVVKYSILYFVWMFTFVFTYYFMINNLAWISFPTGWLFFSRSFTMLEVQKFFSYFLPEISKTFIYIIPGVIYSLFLYIPFLILLIIILLVKKLYSLKFSMKSKNKKK